MDHYELPRRDLTDEPRVRDWLKDTGVAGEERLPVGDISKTSNEFTIHIMDATLSDVPYRFNGNVMNHGLITSLPPGCCVEVPCMTDSQGINPCHVGEAAVLALFSDQLVSEALYGLGVSVAFQAEGPPGANSRHPFLCHQPGFSGVYQDVHVLLSFIIFRAAVGPGPRSGKAPPVCGT